MVAVSEMPSAASRYGILATDAAEAWMPWLSRPCIGLAPGANGSPRRRPSGVLPVALPYTTFEVMVRTDCVWTRVAIGRILSQLAHERADDPDRELIHAVVVVAELREIALGLVVDHQPGLVADHADLGVLDRREAVRHDRQAGHAERHRAHRRVVVQRHLDAFVRVFVVHVVDDVHGVDIHARQPVHHLLELAEHVVEVEIVALAPASKAGPTCSPLISSRPPLMA